MNDPNTYNLYDAVKQIKTNDGKRAGDFLEWQAKLRTGISLYNMPIFNVLQGV